MSLTDIKQLLPKDVYDAAIGANSPSAANVFATMADVGGSGGSAGTSNEHQVTDNAGGFVTSILQETGGQIGVGGVTTSAVFALNSITDLGMTLPTGTVAQRTAITTPVDGLHFYTEDGTTSVPYYNHSVDGWVPVGRYASLGAVIDTGGVPVANKHFVSANMDGEQFYAPFRWGIVSGTTQLYGTDVNGALKSADLGEASGTGRWRDLYCKGSFKHQYGAITAYNAGNAAMTFRANQAGANPQMALVATTNQRGLIIRDDDGATFNLDNSAILELASSTRGILIPRMASPSVTLAAAPPSIIVHDNSIDAPVYKHAIDGFIPIGRYALKNAVYVNGSGNSTLAGNIAAEGTGGSGELKLTGMRWTSNGLYPDINESTGAKLTNYSPHDLGYTQKPGRWRDVYAQQFDAKSAGSDIYFRIATFSGGLAGIGYTTGTSSLSGVSICSGDITQAVLKVFTGKTVKITDVTNNLHTLAEEDSAVLSLDSTTRGFLPPRMTTVEMNAIATPATGLMVYDTTTNQWMGYDGTSWVIIG